MRRSLGIALYDEPEVYDLVSPWPIDHEVAGIARVVRDKLGRAPRSLLDPACGSGRVLEAFARFGMACAGLDLSRAMVEFCRGRLRRFPNVAVSEGDMRDFDLGETFDVAFQPVNTFRLLVEDRDVAAHLRAMRAHLPNGVYVIELWLEGEDGTTPHRDDAWSAGRHGAVARCEYRIEGVDPHARTTRERARVWYRIGDREGSVDDVTTLRLWRACELEGFVRDHGAFRVASWLDGAFEPSAASARRGASDQAYAVLLPA